jgi:hypothetical protein
LELHCEQRITFKTRHICSDQQRTRQSPTNRADVTTNLIGRQEISQRLESHGEIKRKPARKQQKKGKTGLVTTAVHGLFMRRVTGRSVR